MSQKTKYVSSKPKKDVRRINVFVNFNASSTQHNTTLFTAGQKLTIMGYKLRYVMMAHNVALPANFVYSDIRLYVADSGKTLTCDPSEYLGQEVSPQEFERVVLGVQTALLDEVIVDTRSKRKMGKGQTLVLSNKESQTDTDIEFIVHGHIYVGE